jgi:hypothetical protein
VDRPKNGAPVSLRSRVSAALDAFIHPPTRVYGHHRTIHSTGHVDVELSPAGHVVAVWFRCMTLPFEETFVDVNRAVSMVQMYEHQPPHPLVAVEVDPERIETPKPRMYSKIDAILR